MFQINKSLVLTVFSILAVLIFILILIVNPTHTFNEENNDIYSDGLYKKLPSNSKMYKLNEFINNINERDGDGNVGLNPKFPSKEFEILYNSVKKH